MLLTHARLALNAVVLAVTDGAPRVLTVTPDPDDLALSDPRTCCALPLGPLSDEHATLELNLRHLVFQQAGIHLGYAEQLYTFGDRLRDPRERDGAPRLVSIAYLTLGREDALAASRSGRWTNVYDLFPWEDHRDGPPPILRDHLLPHLHTWAEQDPARRDARAQRLDIAFGRRDTPWDEERVLERYELLYEACLVPERLADLRAAANPAANPIPEPLHGGVAMILDHRRILATALGRLRAKIKYRPVVFELLPERFTLLHLQRTVEALAGAPLHKQNFRRLVERGGLVEGTGELDSQTGGRPAELFVFRTEVLRERPDPGVGLPLARRRDP